MENRVIENQQQRLEKKKREGNGSGQLERKNCPGDQLWEDGVGFNNRERSPSRQTT